MRLSIPNRQAAVPPASVRVAVLLLTVLALLAGAVLLRAQTSPPAYAPKPSAAITAGSALPAAQPTSATPASVLPIAQHIEVAYDANLLTVDATNASLNQILREVSGKVGIKVTGGVADERVFGHYGPSTPAVILAALLDGTQSNMLLVEDANGSSELILTPRHGGPTPPNPNAARQEEEAESENGRAGRYVPPIRPFQPPTNTGRGPVSMNPGGNPTDPNAASGQPASTQPADGAQTPQQIFDQLQREQKPAQTPAPQ